LDLADDQKRGHNFRQGADAEALDQQKIVYVSFFEFYRKPFLVKDLTLCLRRVPKCLNNTND
jgi:hypothetical protein